jgi:hypothetical protein
LLQLSNSKSTRLSTSTGVGCNTTYTPKGETHSIAMLVKNAILHLVRDLFGYELGSLTQGNTKDVWTWVNEPNVTHVFVQPCWNKA